MFKRLVLDNWMVIFPLVSFATALAIYVTIVWKALRMKRGQAEHFSQLPFNDQPEKSS